MKNFLDEILLKKRKEIELFKKEKPLNIVYEKIKDNMPKVKDFKKALTSKKINIIAEIKKASPSKGYLFKNMDIIEYAKTYEKAGAVAISVLTEQNFFKGSLDDLIKVKSNVDIPILRKDFIIDVYQIFESRFKGVDSILLIADILEKNDLNEFLDICKTLGLHALVEAHSVEALQKAVDADADIIGINNRSLKDFSVDINTTKKVAQLIPEDKIIVSESGIFEKEDIKFLLDSNVKTFLIGEAIIKSEDPFQKIRSLQDL
jgi:indole-3-glycerol phosphate synthase